MRSSSAPTTNITPAARITPNGSELSSNISRNWSICDATAIAARKPTNIAAPPSVGVGFVCTWRASPDGATTAPSRIARNRTTGVSANVTASATARTIP